MTIDPIARGKLLNRYFILVNIFGFIYSFALNAVYTSFSLYIDYLGESAGITGIIGITTMLASVAGRIVSSRTTDRIGRRFTMILGCLIYAVSVFLTDFFSIIPLIIIFRSLQGMGFSISNTGAAAANVDCSPPEKLGLASSIFYVGSSVSLILCGVVIVPFTDAGAFSLLYTLITILLVIGAFLAFACSYEKKPEYRELRQSLINSEMDAPHGIERFFYKGAVPVSIVSFMLCISFSLIINFIFLFASKEGIYGFGLFFTVGASIALFCNFAGSGLTSRFSPLMILAPCFLLLAAALVFLGISGGFAAYFTAAAAYGITLGLCLPALYAVSLQGVPVNRRGAASSTFLIANDIGYGVGAFIWGLTIDSIGFPASFIIAGVILIPTIILAALFFKERRI